MTEREHEECRRRHAEAALAHATGELCKADEATAPPPAMKLVTPPSSVCDLDEVVGVDEPVVAPEGAIVSDGSDSDEGSARGLEARLSYLEAAHILTRVPTVHPSRVLRPWVDVTGNATWAPPRPPPDFLAVRRAARACLRRRLERRSRDVSAAPLKAERPALWNEWSEKRREAYQRAALGEPARECQLRYDSEESLWAATLRASGAFATANPSAHDEDVLEARTEAGAYATA